MALPKRRTGGAKQGSRRSHHRAQAPQLIRERSGVWRVNHTAGLDRDRKGRLLDDEPRS